MPRPKSSPAERPYGHLNPAFETEEAPARAPSPMHEGFGAFVRRVTGDDSFTDKHAQYASILRSKYQSSDENQAQLAERRAEIEREKAERAERAAAREAKRAEAEANPKPKRPVGRPKGSKPAPKPAAKPPVKPAGAKATPAVRKPVRRRPAAKSSAATEAAF